jgi:hypothetical protein
VLEILLGVEARARLKADGEHLEVADAFHGKDAFGLPPVAVADEVKAAFEEGDVVGVDFAAIDLVAAECVEVISKLGIEGDGLVA